MSESVSRTRPKRAVLRAVTARKVVFHENIFIAKKTDSEFARSVFYRSICSVFAFKRFRVVCFAMKEIAVAQALLACVMLLCIRSLCEAHVVVRMS